MPLPTLAGLRQVSRATAFIATNRMFWRATAFAVEHRPPADATGSCIAVLIIKNKPLRVALGANGPDGGVIAVRPSVVVTNADSIDRLVFRQIAAAIRASHGVTDKKGVETS
jgi:hypothetical protein